MDVIEIFKIVLVFLFSVITFFFIKPRKRLSEFHLLVFGSLIVGFSVFNASFYGKTITDVLLLIDTTGAGKSVVIGYGLMLGVLLRLIRVKFKKNK